MHLEQVAVVVDDYDARAGGETRRVQWPPGELGSVPRTVVIAASPVVRTSGPAPLTRATARLKSTGSERRGGA